MDSSPARIRRAVAIVVIVFALTGAAAPAAGAQQPPLDDDCMTHLRSAALCTGLRKLAERASAECRRPGLVGDENCWAQMGTRVNRRAIAAHRDTLTHRALELQYELGSSVPFKDAPWVGTHNSYNSTSELPTLSHTDSNQQLSLSEQLQIDVRSLEIDVHWFASPRTAADPEGAAASRLRGPVVCHAQNAQKRHAGCSTERLLSDVLEEISAWLAANPRQVLLLYIEDHVDDAVEENGGRELDDGLDDSRRHERVAKVLSDHLRVGGKSVVYGTGGDRGPSCTKLPLDHTREEVLAAGAQVVLVSGCASGASGWGDLVFDFNSVKAEARPRGFRDFPDCGPDFKNRDTYDSRIVRYYEDSTFIGVSPVRESEPDEGLTPETVAAMTRCGVDLTGFDQLLPGDGRLESLVWTWTAKSPPAQGKCPAQRTDSRWHTQPCGQRRPAACRSAAGAWLLTEPVGHGRGDDACEDLGRVFAPPRTGYENAQLRVAAGGADGVETWLGMPKFAK